MQVLSITNGEFYWSKNGAAPTLEDVNMTVKKGELVGILGRVGAGKVCHYPFKSMYILTLCMQSSLISAIIGEMTRTEGEVRLSGCVSYAPQTPWYVHE